MHKNGHVPRTNANRRSTLTNSGRQDDAGFQQAVELGFGRRKYVGGYTLRKCAYWGPCGKMECAIGVLLHWMAHHLLDFSLISDVSEVEECENNGYTYFPPHQLSELKSEPEENSSDHVNSSPCVSDVSNSSPKQRKLPETFPPRLGQSDTAPFPVLGRHASNLNDKAVDLDGLQLKFQRNAGTLHAPVKHQPEVFRDVSVDDHLDNCIQRSTSESAISCINTSKSFRSKHYIEKFTPEHNVSVTPAPLEDRFPRTLATHPCPTDCITVPSGTGKTRDCIMNPSVHYRDGPEISPQVDETTRTSVQTTTSPPGAFVNMPLSDVRDECDWSRPSLHTAKHLIHQINKLTERLNKESLSLSLALLDRKIRLPSMGRLFHGFEQRAGYEHFPCNSRGILVVSENFAYIGSCNGSNGSVFDEFTDESQSPEPRLPICVTYGAKMHITGSCVPGNKVMRKRQQVPRQRKTSITISCDVTTMHFSCLNIIYWGE
ncbi:hypothetical protein CLF_107289 [Clonorchis sinensis]|uniref:Uncharacterized protein n=1 Tax=Clonorchis sinensis TaxID=79923 RepID=H2KRW2_CLOSI|nr:hypothetical protein CLF_107289 [Clonorchis sinensis]